MITLSRLASQLNLEINGNGDPELAGISEDSREIKPGWLFAAMTGAVHDGRNYIADAIKKGAVAVLLSGDDVESSVPRLITPDENIRPVAAAAAAAIYGRPSDKLIMLGLTGTNGKTTTSYLLEAIIARAGLRPGVMGTINSRWAGCERPAFNTTPEGPAINAVLRDMLDDGCMAVVMEVSSHGLALGRVAGLRFEVALFSNLSRDHMDFHKNMEDYYQAKKMLFTKYLKPGPARAVINIDDLAGRRLAEEIGPAALTYGFSKDAQICGSELKLKRNGLELSINVKDEYEWVQPSCLLAEINAYNILGAAALATAMKISPETILEALSAASGAPGRLEQVGSEPDYLVLVDYAHSPDALAKALKACRDVEPERLLLVFGCGGDRDKGKRPIMGRIAGETADLTIITSDNPRTENAECIIREIEAGLSGLGLKKIEAEKLDCLNWKNGSYLTITDRRDAICAAVKMMKAGDALLIAGKGHENYQIIGREKCYFDDRVEALIELEKKGLADQ